jgi:HSP20 family protein
MAVVRLDPFRELEEVSDRLNRVFARPAASGAHGKETMIVADWTPSVDIHETEGEYLIKAEIPDVK